MLSTMTAAKTYPASAKAELAGYDGEAKKATTLATLSTDPIAPTMRS